MRYLLTDPSAKSSVVTSSNALLKAESKPESKAVLNEVAKLALNPESNKTGKSLSIADLKAASNTGWKSALNAESK